MGTPAAATAESQGAEPQTEAGEAAAGADDVEAHADKAEVTLPKAPLEFEDDAEGATVAAAHSSCCNN